MLLSCQMCGIHTLHVTSQRLHSAATNPTNLIKGLTGQLVFRFLHFVTYGLKFRPYVTKWSKFPKYE